MSFSQLEAYMAAAGIYDNPCREVAAIPAPAHLKWAEYKHVLFDMDGLVHRVVQIQHLGSPVHDEVTMTLEPWTGCGVLLKALVREGSPEDMGFRRATTALTCLLCASGRPGYGDNLRTAAKEALFGHAYGRNFSRHRPYSLKGIGAELLGINRPKPTFRTQLSKKLLELAGKP